MKRALVTGGSGTIGASICRALGGAGLHVIVHALRNGDSAARIAAAIVAAGGSAEHVTFDVTDPAACASATTQMLGNGPVQVIVNNAGIHDDVPFAGMRHEQWKRVIDVTLDGFFNVTRPLLLDMLSTRWGRIVNMASVTGLAGNAGQVNYAAAKAGLIGATKALAIEVARRGVTVNAIAPGIIASPMTDALFPPERIKALVPAARAGTPDEVAAAVMYLVSEGAGYVSGEVLSINGAMYR
ncbi:MAG: 3-oxoacyl-ACP reductase FabG [Casimicrobiaceae bacterium]